MLDNMFFLNYAFSEVSSNGQNASAEQSRLDRVPTAGMDSQQVF